MKSAALTLALVLLASSPAIGQPDARVRTVLFAPDKVVRFTGKPGYQSSIHFGADERIENVAVGDSAAWQVTPNKRGDYLFIKPLIAGARSNLMVVTDKRTYLFDLEASRAGQPVYALSFNYPDYPAPGSIQPPPEPVPATSSTQVAAATVTTPAPAPMMKISIAWQVRGAKSLRPARVFADNNAVYLSWPDASALPAVLLPAPDGTESPVDYKVEGGYIVVAGLPQQIIIRRGREQATVTSTRRKAADLQTANAEKRRDYR
jgi:type IV secretion system protein VirB9